MATDLELDVIKKLESIKNIPSLPSVVVKLLSMIENTNTTAKEIGKVMAVDPALTARVLRMVNSAFYNLSNKVTSVESAVVYLGFNMIKNLALTTAVFDSMRGKISKKLYSGMWLHSVAVGMISEILSKKIRADNSEENFTIGILHDLGKIIEITHFNEDFELVLDNAKKNKQSFIDSEKQNLNYNHIHLASWLLSKWELPNSINDTIKEHHSNPSAIYEHNVAILQVADYTAKKLKIGESLSYDIPRFNPEWYRILGVNKNELQDLDDDIKGRITEIEEFLECMK